MLSKNAKNTHIEGKLLKRCDSFHSHPIFKMGATILSSKEFSSGSSEFFPFRVGAYGIRKSIFVFSGLP